MKMIQFYLVTFLLSIVQPDTNLPSALIGNFIDDYNIEYSISDSVWIQYPDFEMNIIMIDTTEMYIIGYDTADSSYTRIDYMSFEHMGDYKWGFCYTAYDKKEYSETLVVDSVNRKTPKTGCSGFPFSRMKRTNE